MNNSNTVTVFFVVAASVIVAPTSAQDIRPLPSITPPPAQDRVEQIAGTSIGVVLDRRANRSDPRYAAEAKVASVDTASLRDSLSYQRSGIVYNYAMQTYGLISGEISFKVRHNVNVTAFAWDQTPPPQRLIGESVFVVNAKSLGEFLRLLKMLRGDLRVLWVEPAIEYVLQPPK